LSRIVKETVLLRSPLVQGEEMERSLPVDIDAPGNSAPGVPATVGQVRKLSSRCAENSGIKTLCKLFALHLQWEKSADEIPLDLILLRRWAFRGFLIRKEFSRERRTRFYNGIDLLLKEAVRLGWVPDQFLSDTWRSFLPEAQRQRCAELVRHFALQGLEAGDLTRHEINVWINRNVQERVYSFSTAWLMASQFTTILLGRGYSNVDQIAAARLGRYGKPLKDFPEPLKTRVEEFISFRLRRADGTGDPDEDEEGDWDDDDVDAPMPKSRKQIRVVSAKKLEGAICRLYGFLCRNGRGDIDRVEQLFEKKVLWRYKEWLISEHKLEPWAVRGPFATLIAAALQHASLVPESVRLARFVRDLPAEPEPQRRARMASKSLPYDDLRMIPQKILADRLAFVARAESDTDGRKRLKRVAKVAVAQLAMREFLIKWMLVLPWRSRNICGCRIHGPNPNLFKRPLKQYPGIRLPQWVKEARARDENVDIWQYSFSPNECKGKARIHRVLPRELIEPLETYLGFRKDLIDLAGRGRDPNTLFVSGFVRKLHATSLYSLMCEITLIYGNKRASAKIIRDVYAFEYLMKHSEPDKFARLAWVLWHKHPDTTRRYYATEYTFSLASVNLERYLKARLRHLPGDAKDDVTDYALFPWIILIELRCLLYRACIRTVRIASNRFHSWFGGPAHRTNQPQSSEDDFNDPSDDYVGPHPEARDKAKVKWEIA
jgi:hypothetical protein